MSEIDFAKIMSESSAPPAAPAPAPEDAASAPASADTAVRDGEQPAEETPAPEPEPKRDRRAEKRIASLTRKVDELLRENGRLQAISEATRPPPAASPPPNQSEFRTYEEYTAALAKHSGREAAQDAAQAIREEARKVVEAERHKAKVETFRQTLEREGKGIEGFGEVMETLFSDAVKVSQPMADYLMDDAEKPALLAQWLVENPDEAESIARMPERKAGAALAKVEAKLGRKPSPPVSRAPAPPPSVTGGGGTAPKPIERMSHDELLKLTRKWSSG